MPKTAELTTDCSTIGTHKGKAHGVTTVAQYIKVVFKIKFNRAKAWPDSMDPAQAPRRGEGATTGYSLWEPGAATYSRLEIFSNGVFCGRATGVTYHMNTTFKIIV